MLEVEVAAPDVGVDSPGFMQPADPFRLCRELKVQLTGGESPPGPLAWVVVDALLLFVSFFFFFFLESRAACSWPQRPCRKLWPLLRLCRTSTPGVDVLGSTKPGKSQLTFPRTACKHSRVLCKRVGAGVAGWVYHFQLQQCKKSVQVKWPALAASWGLQFGAICRPLPQQLSHSQEVFVSRGCPTSCHLASQESSGIK